MALACSSCRMAKTPEEKPEPAQAPGTESQRPNIRIVTTKGTVLIELYPDIAPKHVERMKQLAKDGFYAGILFHRIVPDFVEIGRAHV